MQPITNVGMSILCSVALFGCGVAGGLGNEDGSARQLLVVSVLVLGNAGLLASLRYGVRAGTRAIVGCAVFFLFCYTVSLVLGAPRLNRDAFLTLKYLAQIFLVCGWLCFNLQVAWERSAQWWTPLLTGNAVLLVNVAYWAASGCTVPFVGLAGAKNGLAACGLVGVFLGYAALKVHRQRVLRVLALSMVTLALITIVASGSRAAVLSLIVAMVVYAAWPLAVGSIARFRLMFGALAICLFAMTSVLPGMSDWRSSYLFNYWRLNRQVKEVSGLEINTGRDVIWPQVMAGVKEHPVFGNGSGAPIRFERSIGRGRTVEQSAHNLYLAVIYQAGFVGLIGLLVLVYGVWMLGFRRAQMPSWARIGTAFFAAMLFRETFEVSLTQNNLIVGISTWTFVGCMLRTSIRRPRAVPAVPRANYASLGSRRPAPKRAATSGRAPIATLRLVAPPTRTPMRTSSNRRDLSS